MKNFAWKHIVIPALLLALSALASGCGSRTQVILLEGLDGKVGAIEVSSAQGSQVVDSAYGGVNLSKDGEAATFVATKDEVERTYGEALKSLPPEPVVFMVYFRSDSTDLVPDSEKIMKTIVDTAAGTDSPKISIVGHTDTLGDENYNYRLALRRAKYVMKRLVAGGIAAESIVEVTSHGPNNPVVPTADNVSEPKNRRVEVTIR